MKTNNLKIIESGKVLSTNEQQEIKTRLRPLLKLDGVISLCLDSEYLFIEYKAQNISFKNLERLILETRFPAKQVSKLAS
ncbi:MAG TPA: hypothetical protein VEP89_16700 [Draconibacterium sp.]|nr:hypothetical protein [Draconibacterium sp.]